MRRRSIGVMAVAIGVALTGCATDAVDPSRADRARPEAIELADAALAWPGSDAAPRITLSRGDSCTSVMPSDWFVAASGTRCSQVGRVAYALPGAATPEAALEQAAAALRDSNISPVDPFDPVLDPGVLGDPALGLNTTQPASKAYGTDETAIALATVERFLDRLWSRPTDEIVSSTPGLEGDELARATRATGTTYVLEIQYVREYYDSEEQTVDRAPRNDPPPCFGTSGYCPGG